MFYKTTLVTYYYYFWSHFILGGLNYYVLTSKRFGGMGWFKGGLRCKGWVNSVIIYVITEINYRCIYMQVFKRIYTCNVKTCMFAINTLY